MEFTGLTGFGLTCDTLSFGIDAHRVTGFVFNKMITCNLIMIT